MPIKGIEVGSWKLEDKPKIEIKTQQSTQIKLLGLLSMMPVYGNRTGNDYSGLTDLEFKDDTGALSLVTVKNRQRRMKDGEARFVNELELRFGQQLRINGEVFVLNSIFRAEDYALHMPPTLVGGRKMWSNFAHRADRPCALKAPGFHSQTSMLEVIEELCPVTEAGIVAKLDAMPEGVERQHREAEIRKFENAARELVLTP